MLFKSDVSIMTMWDVPFVSFLQSTNSKTSITQRCLCPTHMGSRAFHIAVLLKGGWTRRQRRRNKGKSRCRACHPGSLQLSPQLQRTGSFRGGSLYNAGLLAAGDGCCQGNRRAVGMQSQPSNCGCTCNSASSICSNGTHTSKSINHW